jgi:predicted transcriptional regulator of viral defense system
MADVATTGRTLSRNESKVVLALEWRGEKIVTLGDIRRLLGGSEGYARFLAHQLVHKGWLERLRPGLFLLIPADRGPEGVGDTNPLAAGAALVRPYFFSFGTACTHHGLTEQVFGEVYIACKLRRRPRVIRSTRYVFVELRPEQFFGFREVNVLGEPVQMATPERALLDALDRPRYGGGLREVSRMVSQLGSKVSWRETVDLLSRWGDSALVQRFGYLLDLHGVELHAETRAELTALVRPASKIHLGPRRKWGDAGKLIKPWNVIANVTREALVEIGAGPRRRVSFAKREPPRDR